MHDKGHVAVIDFGSQYTQLIVRRVRELGFFAMLYALEDFPEIQTSQTKQASDSPIKAKAIENAIIARTF